MDIFVRYTLAALGLQWFDVITFHLLSFVLTGKDGINCLLLEKKKFPRDKYCGDAVCKTGIEILKDMGVYDELIKQKKARVVCLFVFLSQT